jgi:hypothetical protein
MHTEFQLGNIKGKYYLGEGDKIERITLKWSLGR